MITINTKKTATMKNNSSKEVLTAVLPLSQNGYSANRREQIINCELRDMNIAGYCTKAGYFLMGSIFKAIWLHIPTNKVDRIRSETIPVHSKVRNKKAAIHSSVNMYVIYQYALGFLTL